MFLEPAGDDHAGRGRLERTTELVHVAAILDCFHNRGVGRRASDAALLELLDEAGLGVAVGWFGLLLLAGETEQGNDFTRRKLRELHVLSARLRVCRQPAREDEARTVRAELGNFCIGDYLHARTQNLRTYHLRGECARANQFINTLL